MDKKHLPAFIFAVALCFTVTAQPPPSSSPPQSVGVAAQAPPQAPPQQVPAPAPAPAPSMPSPTRPPPTMPSPQPPQSTALIPAPPGQNPVTPQVALWIKQAMDDLAKQQESGPTGSAVLLLGRYPLTALVMVLIGVFRIVGLPIHTWLDNRLQKNLSPSDYAKVKTDGGSAFKTFDWLVNLFFSVKPSTISASGKTKAAPTALNASNVEAMIEQKVAEILAARAKGPPAVSLVAPGVTIPSVAGEYTTPAWMPSPPPGMKNVVSPI